MKLMLALMFIPIVACAEVQQGSPNTDFEPAFADQTRADALPQTAVTVETFATGLDRPWGIAALPDGRFLVTERSGALRMIGANGAVSEPLSGVPQVAAQGQGGLLDVAVADDFAQTGQVFMTYAKPVSGGAVTAAARGVLTESGLVDVVDIFVQTPVANTGKHYGSRIIPMTDGTVWITTGEHSDRGEREKAQDVETTFGKVIRVNRDGTVPGDNPFVGRAGIDSIWSYGHRNMQGAAIGPDGALWTVEHGPRGGDELNRPAAGLNYGWPVISYGINYRGTAVGSGDAVRDGMEQPVYYWDPVIAPGGMAFYDGGYADWRGDLLVGSLNPGALVRLKMEGGRVVGEERLLTDVGRVRDVEVLDDGSVLVLIDAGDGAVLRVVPQ